MFKLNVDKNRRTRSSSAHLSMSKADPMFRSVGWSNSFHLSDSTGLFAQHTANVRLQSHDFNDVKTEGSTRTTVQHSTFTLLRG